MSVSSEARIVGFHIRVVVYMADIVGIGLPVRRTGMVRACLSFASYSGQPFGCNVYDVLESTVHKNRIVQIYEWFLELPVVIVLAVLWLAGAGIVGLCVLALYLCRVLLQAVVGT